MSTTAETGHRAVTHTGPLQLLLCFPAGTKMLERDFSITEGNFLLFFYVYKMKAPLSLFCCTSDIISDCYEEVKMFRAADAVFLFAGNC